MFLVPGGYGSAGLSHVFLIACFTFYLIYSAWIFCSVFFFSAGCWYIVFCGFECYANFGVIEQICYPSYYRTMVCECYPFFLYLSFLCVVCFGSFVFILSS